MSLEISAETSFALDLTNAQQYGPELLTDANAASDPNGNEADATTGWTPVSLTGTGANVFESQGAVKNTGSYALHADANDTPTANAGFNKTVSGLDAGETYKFTGVVRHTGTGGKWVVAFDGAVATSIPTESTTFFSFEFEKAVAGSSVAILISENSATNDGGVYVDNLSLKKVL